MCAVISFAKLDLKDKHFNFSSGIVHFFLLFWEIADKRLDYRHGRRHFAPNLNKNNWDKDMGIMKRLYCSINRNKNSLLI